VISRVPNAFLDQLRSAGADHPEGVVEKYTDPQKVALAQDLQKRYPPDPEAPYGVPNVLRTGEPELVPEIPESVLDEAARDGEHREILRRLALKSHMVVPLVARGRMLGAISFVAAESGRRYGPTDLEVAEDLARRAALAIDNAQLYGEAQEEIAERKRAETHLRTLVEQIPAITYIEAIDDEERSTNLLYADLLLAFFRKRF
jgi:GAF domain-containing protein